MPFTFVDATKPEPLPPKVTVKVNIRTPMTVCVAVLLAGARSGWSPVTSMVLELDPAAVAVTTMLTCESTATGNEPILQLTVPFDCAQLPRLAFAETKVTLFGRV